jgi:hypothetical protein
MYFWPLMYFCLGTLVLVLRPHNKQFIIKHNIAQISLTMIIIFIFATGPLIVRNIIALKSTQGRTVYAYSNLDIDPASFGCQLANFLIFSRLLAILWHQWISYSAKFLVKSNDHSCDAVKAMLNADTLDALSAELRRFQTAFAVLSIGFIGYTAIFWKQVIDNGDFRFILESFFAHAFWIISAVLIALPFWRLWLAWRRNRVRAIGQLIQAPSEAGNLEAKLNSLATLHPVGSWDAAALIATIGSSLAAPAIQLILKLAHVG